MNILTMKGITKAYTDRVLIENGDFSLDDHDKVGIVGINGTGKSTLLRMIAGREDYDAGEYTVGNHVMMNYLPQNPEFAKGMTIYDYVIRENQTDSLTQSIEGEAKTILNRLGFTQYDIPIEQLSGGQQKRVALAAALLAKKEVLLLDEPTNHLDNDMTEWLEEYLRNLRCAIVMVTHDRYFLDLVCNRIVEIDRTSLYSYDTNYEGFLARKAEREEIAHATEKKHANILRKEIEWIRRGARARSTKQKAHIARYEALRDEEKIAAVESVQISAVSSRLGKKTIECYDLAKSYGQKQLINGFTYTFLKDDRVGILGPNGCGKTTLLGMITGGIAPDHGHVEIGETVRIGYYAQHVQDMDPTERVIDYIRDEADYIKMPEGTITASQMLERFLFTGSMQYGRIEKLSGGEKRRLYLARVLMEAPNVLILDEPTNDLDIQTLCILEDYLDTFPGILILVSHDRYFLDRVTRRMLTFEDAGTIRLYNGSYTQYYQERKERMEASGVQQKKKEAAGEEDGMRGGESAGALAYQEQKKLNRKLKFTYQEQKDYETIESDIEALEEKIASLEKESLTIATDFVKLNQLTKEKEEVEKALEEKMERYIYLEELAERIAAQSE